MTAHLALDPARWARARADADALLVRREYHRRKSAGASQPQVGLAAELATAQQNVSLAVKRGKAVLGDPDRLRDAHSVAKAAGVSPRLLAQEGTTTPERPN